jgi:sporulation protein YlmC with PRC-barrel domain
MKHMKRSFLVNSVAACFCLVLATPLLAAEPSATGAVNPPVPREQNASAATPAEKCLADLRAFDHQLEEDGFLRSGFDSGYGDPMTDGRAAAAARPLSPPPSAKGFRTSDYQNARPGYEIRILLASAIILARHGQQQPCEDVLATSRDTYKLYVSDAHGGGARVEDVPAWRKLQISAAQPVASQNAVFRSDQLLGTDVRDPQNESLGSVDDIVMSPQTGKIAYLVVARGGIFGIGEKYVAVPWQNFRVTPNANLLVLDTTKAAMDAAPQIKSDQFASGGNFDQESQKIDSYWAHRSDKGTTGSHN